VAVYELADGETAVEVGDPFGAAAAGDNSWWRRRGTPMIPVNSLLVATDLGPTSEAALTYGRNIARAFGATLHVLHVADSAGLAS
jgi:hypothetical protein